MPQSGMPEMSDACDGARGGRRTPLPARADAAGAATGHVCMTVYGREFSVQWQVLQPTGVPARTVTLPLSSVCRIRSAFATDSTVPALEERDPGP